MSSTMKDGETLTKCPKCGTLTAPKSCYGTSYCEDCFDAGLIKDMNEHWDNYWEQELGPPVGKLKE